MVIFLKFNNKMFTINNSMSSVLRILNTDGTKTQVETTHIKEGTNLYYTENRAQDAARGAVSLITSGSVSYDTSSGVFDTTALESLVESNNTDVNNRIGNLETDVSNLTTDNIAEGSFLYYTNDRARGAVSLSSNGNVSYDSQTGVFDTTALENLVVSNDTDVNNRIDSLNNALTNDINTLEDNLNQQIQFLTTDDVSETSTNQYYTDARARGAVSLSSNGNVSYDSQTGVFDTTALENLVVSNDTDVNNRIDNLDTNVSNLTTDDVPETSTNQYYTDARVNAVIDGRKTNDLAPLVSGKIPTEYIPSLAITETFVVADQGEQDDLTVQKGDVAIRTDINNTFIYTGDQWVAIETPADGVQSVNGKAGASVTLFTGDVDESTGSFSDLLDESGNAIQAVRKYYHIQRVINDLVGKDIVVNSIKTQLARLENDTYVTGNTLFEGNTVKFTGAVDFSSATVYGLADLALENETLVEFPDGDVTGVNFS